MPTALVLGATSDIGLAIARKLAEKGYDLQLAGRDLDALRPIATDTAIRSNMKTCVLRFDAADTGSHAGFFRELAPIPDITIYVIGYMSGSAEALRSWSETEKMLTANYNGAVSILNLVASHYAAEKKGTIVGISSVAGDRGRGSNFIYGSAKAGFTAYLSGLRNYLYPFGVHVLTVKPGFVYTRMTEGLDLPPALTSTPSQVASAVWKALDKRKNSIYIKGIWRWIMLAIRSIPEFQFKKMKL